MRMSTPESAEANSVYDLMNNLEIIFWILNIGYVANEIHQMIYEGSHYLDSKLNSFDVLVSVSLIGAFTVRVYTLSSPIPNCSATSITGNI